MIISPNPIIVVLIGLSFMLASLQITCNCYIGVTRIMVGMSLDRTLPAWLSKINTRFRSPLNAHLIYFLLGVAWLIGYTYVASWAKLTLGVTFAAGYVFVVSAWRRPCCRIAPRRSTRPPRARSTSSAACRS